LSKIEKPLGKATPNESGINASVLGKEPRRHGLIGERDKTKVVEEGKKEEGGKKEGRRKASNPRKIFCLSSRRH
jgi:hypothetical protein